MGTKFLIILAVLLMTLLVSFACEQKSEPLLEKNAPIKSNPVLSPDFAVTNLKVNPIVANLGEFVKVSAMINNRGGQGDYKAVLMLDKEIIDTKIVTVGEKSSIEVVFSPKFTKMGKSILSLGETPTALIVSDCSSKNPFTIKYDAGTATNYNIMSYYATGNMGQITRFTPPALPFTIQKIRMHAFASVDNDSELDQHVATLNIWDANNKKLWTQDYPWRRFLGEVLWKEFEVPNINTIDDFSVELVSHSEAVQYRGHSGRYTCISLFFDKPRSDNYTFLTNLRSGWSINGVLQKGRTNVDDINWLIRVEGQGCLLENKAE